MLVVIEVSRSEAAMVNLLSAMVNKKSSKIGRTGFEPMEPAATCNCFNNSVDDTLNLITFGI
jgi:hypothetical protein